MEDYWMLTGKKFAWKPGSPNEENWSEVIDYLAEVRERIEDEDNA